MALLSLHKPGVFAVVRCALNDFSRDAMSIYASALAYRALFSLFPFVIFVVALLGFLDMPQLFEWLRQQAALVVPGEAMKVVDRVLNEVRTPQGGLLSFGVALALFSASSGVATAMEALNVAYDVEEHRPVWKRYALALLYTVAIAVIVILAAALMVTGPQFATWIAEQVGLQDAMVTAWTWLRWPIAVLLLMLVASLVYYAGPDLDHRFRFVTPGAIIAVVAWIAASVGFGYYVSTIGDYNATYGSLGAVVILVFYFFLSAAVFLFGAEVNAVIERGAAGPASSGAIVARSSAGSMGLRTSARTPDASMPPSGRPSA
jgi:membrane protein